MHKITKIAHNKIQEKCKTELLNYKMPFFYIPFRSLYNTKIQNYTRQPNKTQETSILTTKWTRQCLFRFLPFLSFSFHIFPPFCRKKNYSSIPNNRLFIIVLQFSNLFYHVFCTITTVQNPFVSYKISK